ncbi:MAG: cupin domain-containing protein, partial [Desulfitobacterium hafniense]|nr:cupin domain-containing protein [Desulfitobacterium hafniense]
EDLRVGGEITPEDEGGARQPHIHPDMEEVIFVLEGKGRIWVEEQEEDIITNDLIVVPMKLRHRIINPEGTLKILCFFPAAKVGIP